MLKKIFSPRAIFILILSLIIIFLTFIKITSNTNDQSSSDSSITNQTSDFSTSSLSPSIPIPTIVNIGPTNSFGEIMFYDQDTGIEPPTSANSSYIAPTLTPQEEEDMLDISLDFPLARLLPYKGTYFQATRYIGVNNLEIIVFNKKQTDLAKKEAQSWLVETGADKYDHFTVVYK